MSKLTLTRLQGGYLSTAAVNANQVLLEAALENTLSRDGSTPNVMRAQLDMNSNRLVNLVDAVNNQEPVTLAQAALIAGVSSPLTQDTVGAVLWPTSADEASAGVSITKFYYEYNDPRRYGALHDPDKTGAGTDNSAAFEAAVSVSAETIPVKFTGQVGDVTLKNPLNGFNIGVILAKAGSTSVFNLVKDDTADGWGVWNTLTFENLYLDLLGADPGGANARTIHGFSYPVTPSSTDKTLAGRNEWHNVTISRADIAIYLPTGNFGNYLYNVVLKSGNYGVFGVESNTPQIMHPGLLYIQDGEISGMRKAAIYLKCPTENVNGIRLVHVSIEGNEAHGVYFDGLNLCPDGPVLDQVHFENNDSQGDGTIDLGFGRGSETIRDLMCHDVDHIVIRKTHIPSSGFEFNNSMALLDGCFFQNASRLQQDASSVVICTNANLDGISYLADVEIVSLVQQRRPSGANGATMRAKIPPRTHIITKLPGSGVSRQSVTFDEVEAFGALTGVKTLGGGASGLYKHHNRYAPNPSSSYTQPLIALTNGKWYVYTTEFMLEQLTIDVLSWQGGGGNFLAAGFHNIVNNNVIDGDWQAMGGVCEYDGTTGNVRLEIDTDGSAPFFNFAPSQCIEFDTQSEAIAYFNSGAFFDGNILAYNGVATLSGGTLAIDFSTEGFQDQPNDDYNIALTAKGSTHTYVSAQSDTGFTITGGTTDVVMWEVKRRDL